MVTVQEIQTQRTVLSSTSIHENIIFLNKIGHYFEQTRPSNIEYDFIYETEGLINELYVKSLQEPGASQITEHLLEAISQAGSLAIGVNNETFDANFVRTAKQLGRTLIRISRIRI